MIFDIEANGLLEDATKIHVMAYTHGNKILHTSSYDEMKELLLEAKVLIGHNIICYDIPLVEKLLGIKIKARLIDTLPLSWYLFFDRPRHGLEVWGEHYGVEKPKIDDWENLSVEDYAHRCKEDVLINKYLWEDCKEKLLDLYGSSKDSRRLINYLSFKMKCVREQEKSRWKVDLNRVNKNIEELSKKHEEISEKLADVMPLVHKYDYKTRPKKPFRMDGSYSKLGEEWFKLLESRGLPEDYQGSIELLKSSEKGNPSSNPQIKNWLTDLGWVPCSFKYTKHPDGNPNQIPQVRVDNGDGKELAPSVIRLIEDNPEVALLQDITVIAHRLSVFNGFLRDQKDGYLQATVAGLTNTLRFKHRELVNLPGVDKAYGAEIRGCLIAEGGQELCGSDMVSLESTTKRHYMFPYDPDYVAEMSKPGFDEHLDLAKLANEVSQEEINLYNEKKGDIAHVKKVRKKFKPANYAGIYGVGKTTMSRQTGMSEAECARLLEIYWKRNWSVKKVAADQEVKYLGKEMWLFNPVSKLWYSLRAEKDIFSTLNQGTGVFCFDSWIKEVLSRRNQLTAQFHDEGVWSIKTGHREQMTAVLKDSIEAVNKKLNLNVPLDVDVQFGNSYAEIH